MEDKELITNATQLLSELNKSFQSCKQGTADDFRLQELLNATLQELKKAEKLDNSILIDLEKFYQRTSLLIGLGSLKLNDQARTAWRNYDKFHYEHVKHVLTLYGPVFWILEIRISNFLLTKYPERYRIEVLILGGKGDMNN